MFGYCCLSEELEAFGVSGVFAGNSDGWVRPRSRPRDGEVRGDPRGGGARGGDREGELVVVLKGV